LNLIVTTRCNRACSYCFAQSKSREDGESPGATRTDVTIEEVETYLAFLESGSIREMKILGGEPTLHPELERILDCGLSRGFDITVFTNGLWNGAARDLFRDEKTANVGFIFNINEPSVTPEAEAKRVGESLTIAGKRGSCGFNICHPGFDLTFLGDLIARHGLGRTIRLGLASPIAGADNVHIAPKEMPGIGSSLVRQLEILEQGDVLGELDCGFPVCMFTTEELGRLRLVARTAESACEFPVDIGPGLLAWPCFPLSTVTRTDLRAYETPGKLLAAYEDALTPFRCFGMMDDCLTCKYRIRGQCCGGCLAHAVRNVEDGGDPRILEKVRSALSQKCG
jgi:Radical SAM superfamily/4Fe-4S single cluster domain